MPETTHDFHPFDPHGVVEVRQRDLPHWEQPGANYFVTFRLADSFPRSLLQQWAELRRAAPRQVFNWMERQLDAGHGTTLFRNAPARATVEAGLRHFDGKRYALGEYVIMPNHVHALVVPRGAFALESILHTWKSFSAQELQRQGLGRGRIWQEESFDHIVRNETELLRVRKYIEQNPEKACLRPGEFALGKGTAIWPE